MHLMSLVDKAYVLSIIFQIYYMIIVKTQDQDKCWKTKPSLFSPIEAVNFNSAQDRCKDQNQALAIFSDIDYHVDSRKIISYFFKSNQQFQLSCVTINGKKCNLPFEYDQNLYRTCTYTGLALHKRKNGPWCPMLDEDNSSLSWDYCDVNACKTEESLYIDLQYDSTLDKLVWGDTKEIDDFAGTFYPLFNEHDLNSDRKCGVLTHLKISQAIVLRGVNCDEDWKINNVIGALCRRMCYGNYTNADGLFDLEFNEDLSSLVVVETGPEKYSLIILVIILTVINGPGLYFLYKRGVFKVVKEKYYQTYLGTYGTSKYYSKYESKKEYKDDSIGSKSLNEEEKDDDDEEKQKKKEEAKKKKEEADKKSKKPKQSPYENFYLPDQNVPSFEELFKI